MVLGSEPHTPPNFSGSTSPGGWSGEKSSKTTTQSTGLTPENSKFGWTLPVSNLLKDLYLCTSLWKLLHCNRLFSIFFYCITCTYCKKIYIGETGRRLGDRFREHLRDIERNDKDASKPVASHFNLPSHSKQHMAICGLSLHSLEQKFIFQIGTLTPIGINERFSFY